MTVALAAVLAASLGDAVPTAQAKSKAPAAKSAPPKQGGAAKAKPVPAKRVTQVKPQGAKAKPQTVQAPTLTKTTTANPTQAAGKKTKKAGRISSKRVSSATSIPQPSAPTRPVAGAGAPSAVATPTAGAPGAPTTPSTARERRTASRNARRRTSTGSRSRPDRARPARARALAALSGSSSGPLLSAGTPSLALVAASDQARRSGSDASRERSTSEREDSPSTVTRTVRDIVEVVPGPLKAALLGLALLSAVLAGGYLLSAARARRLARQRAELLQDVGLLQTALLPPVPAVVGALRTSVAYRPSEGPGAGGDFYDALPLPGGKAAFILGDVCGHGRQALARTAFVRYTLRAYLEAGLEPGHALQVAAPVIDQHLGGSFATVIVAVHDSAGGSLTYACAGHPPPIVVGPNQVDPVLAGSSPPLGLSLRTGVRQTTVPLPPGSVVCLYTDGLPEARTSDGILGRARLVDILRELGRDATADALIVRVAEEARLVTDDMATVVLSPTAGVTAGGFREERLEVDLSEVLEGLAEDFLEACGVNSAARTEAVAEAQRCATSHGAAVIQVRFGTRGPIVGVLPRNVESLADASRGKAPA